MWMILISNRLLILLIIPSHLCIIIFSWGSKTFPPCVQSIYFIIHKPNICWIIVLVSYFLLFLLAPFKPSTIHSISFYSVFFYKKKLQFHLLYKSLTPVALVSSFINTPMVKYPSPRPHGLKCKKCIYFFCKVN